MDAPAFFVPGATPENQEQVYEELAKRCGLPRVPDPSSRVYSITFTSRGEEWTATVGEYLRGIKRQPSRSKADRTERTESLEDPATVYAIFPGLTYKVITDHGILPGVRSEWVNPFLAGEPSSITCFSEDVPAGL